MLENGKPAYLAELEELRTSGGLEKVSQLIEGKAKAWVKRSSGAWQECEAYELGHAGLTTGVKWIDSATGKQSFKHVDTTDFIKWQNEEHLEV